MKATLMMLALFAIVVTCALPTAHADDEQASAQQQQQRQRRNVAILAFEGVELLDFAGPAEVFQVAAHGTGAYSVQVVGATLDPIVSMGLVTITPTHSIETAPHPARIRAASPVGRLGEPSADARLN